MVNFKLLIVAASLAFIGSANAGYAQLAPPPTWSKTATDTLVRVAANDASFPGGIRAGFASFNTGASLVQVPAAYRFAANAGRFAATAAFGWPAVMLAAGGLAYQWYQENGFSVQDGVWKKDSTELGVMLSFTAYSTLHQSPYWSDLASQYQATLNNPNKNGVATIFNYVVTPDPPSNPFRLLNVVTRKSDGSWYSSGYEPVNKTTQEIPVKVPVSRSEFEETMAPKPVPLGVPQVWPLQEPMWWPVDPKPIINPSPEPVPATNPLPVPVPQPMRIPQGEPIQLPNPNYDPVTNPEPYIWRQPVIDLVPSPTPDDPWRVDVQPKDIIKTNPEPITDPESVPDPANDPNATPSEKSDLCADHPEILACAKPELDTPESDPLDNIEKPLSFLPDTGWAGGDGFCPAPRHLGGANVDFKFDMVCDFMNGIRPVVLAIAAFVGGMILIGARGGAAE